MELASLIISIVSFVVSGAVAAVVAWWIQSKMDKRELTKWRRDTLTKASVDFVTLSAKHENLLFKYIYEDDSATSSLLFFELTETMDSLDACILTLKVCDSQHVLPVLVKRFNHNKQSFVDLPLKFVDEEAAQDYLKVALEDAPRVSDIHAQIKEDLTAKYKI